MECVCEANENIDYCKEKPLAGSEAPGQEYEGEKRYAVWRQGNGNVAKPSTAERNVTVFLVDLKPMNLPKEQNSEDQMGELVREFHKPASVTPYPRDKKEEEE